MKIFILYLVLKFICSINTIQIDSTVPVPKVIVQNKIVKTAIYQNQEYTYKLNQNNYDYSFQLVNYVDLYAQNIFCKVFHDPVQWLILSNITLPLDPKQIIVKAQMFKQYQSIILITSYDRIIHYKLQKLSVQIIKTINIVHKITNTLRLQNLMYIFTTDQTYRYDVFIHNKVETTSEFSFVYDFIKAVQYNNTLVVLRENSIIEDIHNISQVTKLQNSQNLVDIVIKNNKAFVLDEKMGIFIVDLISHQVKLFQLKTEGFLKKLIVANQMIWCLYDYRKKKFLIEIYLSDTLKINKIYTSNKNIQNVLIIDRIGIMLSQKYLSLFEHSINRMFPHRQYLQILKKISIFGLIDAFGLDNQNIIIIGSNNLLIMNLPKISPTQMNCSLGNQSNYKIVTLSNFSRCQASENLNQSVKSSYCSIQTIHQIQVLKPMPKERIKIIQIILIVIIIFLVLICIVFMYSNIRSIKNKESKVRLLQDKLRQHTLSEFHLQNKQKIEQHQHQIQEQNIKGDSQNRITNLQKKGQTVIQL